MGSVILESSVTYCRIDGTVTSWRPLNVSPLVVYMLTSVWLSSGGVWPLLFLTMDVSGSFSSSGVWSAVDPICRSGISGLFSPAKIFWFYSSLYCTAVELIPELSSSRAYRYISHSSCCLCHSSRYSLNDLSSSMSPASFLDAI